jgi:DNA-binding response OmpR family regulator
MSNPRASLRGRRVVVAAADPRLVRYVTHVLHEADCRVFQAYDALAAYTLASGVIQVDGDTLINALRRRLPRLPVLHLSAGEQRDREVEANLPPDVPTLEEPFTDGQLLQAVRATLS